MKDTHDWVIVGAGGFAREVAATIEGWDANGGILMAVEPQYLPDPPQVGMYEVTTIEDAWERVGQQAQWILGIGNVGLRQRLVALVNGLGKPVTWGAMRNATAPVAYDVAMAQGAYIGTGTVVSVGAVLGEHSLINQCCSIGHDVHVGAHAVVCPGCILSGNVHVGPGAFLGSGVVVKPGIRIGEGATVAAGTTVSKHVPPHNLRYPSQSNETRDLRDRQ